MISQVNLYSIYSAKFQIYAIRKFQNYIKNTKIMKIGLSKYALKTIHKQLYVHFVI